MTVSGQVALSIDDMLTAARSRLRRMTPHQAASAVDDGALLVDIRPQGQRRREGEVPGSLVIERNVLEWRFDPTNAARLAAATGHDVRVVVMCSQGYTSSLAAASLQEIGLGHSTDIVGGFQAWSAAGLPTTAGGREPDEP